MSLILNRLKNLSKEVPIRPESVEEDDQKAILAETPEPTTSKKRLEEISQKEEVPGILEETAQQTGRKYLSSILAAPKTVAQMVSAGSKKLAELGEEQAAEQGRLLNPEEIKFTQGILKALGYPAQLIEEHFPSYTQENIEKKLMHLQKLTGVKPVPQEPISKEAKTGAEIGQTLGLATVLGGPKTLGTRLGVTGEIEAGTRAAESAGLGKTGQTIAGFSTPAIIEIVRAIKNKKYIPAPGEAQQLYERAKDLGMSDEELAPILATRSQVSTFGKLAGGTERTEKALEQSNISLRKLREDIVSKGKELGKLPKKVQNDLVKDFSDLREKLSKTLHPAPKEKELINFLDNAIDRLKSGNTTVDEIMNFRKSINAIEGGETALGSLKEPMQKAIAKIDPKVAQDFKDYNQLYSMYAKNLSKINPDMLRNFLGAGEVEQILGSVFTGEPLKAAVQSIRLPLFSRLSSRIITDPVLQSIHRSIGRAIQSGNKKLAKGAYVQLQKYVDREFPEESSEINWPDFD